MKGNKKKNNKKISSWHETSAQEVRNEHVIGEKRGENEGVRENRDTRRNPIEKSE